MKKRPPLPDSLRRRISSLDARSIDELYGLEPVYEPGKRGRCMHEEFVSVQCPYCGERFETRIDLTSDDSGYVEDCQVCCRPWLMYVKYGRDGSAEVEVYTSDS